MKSNTISLRFLSLLVGVASAWCVSAQDFGGPPPPDGPDFGDGPAGGPDGFGPGRGGPGGPGGMNREEIKLVKQFDKNGDKRLNSEERKAAREYINKQGTNRRQGGPGGRRGGFGPPGMGAETAKPGPRVSPSDVKSFPDAPLYASNVLRTMFLDFENADWEKELEDFHGTDVEVPAKLTVDGKTYRDVGIHFRGASSYMMLGTGQKRSLNLSLDYMHEDQNLGGYRTLNLLNSHGDPTYLRAVLAHTVARDYLPAPQANLVRVVINGESWGVYVNAQQFNKDFVKEWFGTKTGARWKAPGSPNGRATLAYLGDDPSAYKRAYEIKSKDDPQSWTNLIQLCKTLNNTPADKLEAALAPLLDIDGALRFLAVENALINNDGYWVRTSDYDLYQDEKGRFHILPYDANETFSTPGGPGFGGPGGFGPGMVLAQQILSQGDKNGDRKLTKAEFSTVADMWFDKLDPEKTGKVSQDQFNAKLSEIIPPPPGMPGFGPRGGDGQQRGGRGGPGGRGRFGPESFMGQGLFSALDSSKDGSLTQSEVKETLAKWFEQWDEAKKGSVDEDKIRDGLGKVLPQPNFGGPGRRGGQRGGGPGGGIRVNGVELDPLVAASDANKPLISKLLAVPSLRERYLGYVRNIAEKWLDWRKLGPIVQQYQTLIDEQVKADTRKLDSYEAFVRGVSAEAPKDGAASGPGRGLSLRSFAGQRRTYLMNYVETRKAAQ